MGCVPSPSHIFILILILSLAVPGESRDLDACAHPVPAGGGMILPGVGDLRVGLPPPVKVTADGVGSEIGRRASLTGGGLRKLLLHFGREGDGDVLFHGDCMNV